MKKKYILINSIIFILLSSAFSGCISSDNVSATEIKMFTLDSSIDINTYRFLMDMVISTDMGGSKIKMNYYANGAVDIDEHKLMMEMRTSTIDSVEMDLLYYILDETVFIKMDYFGSEQWMKMNFSDYNVSWDSYDQMSMQLDLLDYGEVERLNDEVYDNEDCYVLKIIPDFEKLYKILMNQQVLNNGMIQDFALSDVIKDFSLKLWISKDNNLILKAYEYMSMEISLFGYTYSMTFEINIKFADYNEHVNIELPEEAQNAVSYLNYISGVSSSPPA